MRLEVEWRDRELRQGMRRAATAMPGEINKAVRFSTLEVSNRAKQNIKSKLNTTGRSTGHLSSSIGHRFDKTRFEGETGPTAIYGRIHELGGTVLPVKGPFLTFMGSAGHLVRVRSVRIPPRPYMRPAWRDSQPAIRGHFRDALKKALGEP